MGQEHLGTRSKALPLWKPAPAVLCCPAGLPACGTCLTHHCSVWWRAQVCINILNWYSYSMEEIGFKCNIQASLVAITDLLTKNYHHHIRVAAAHTEQRQAGQCWQQSPSMCVSRHQFEGFW